jgi:hypothetical protein
MLAPGWRINAMALCVVNMFCQMMLKQVQHYGSRRVLPGTRFWFSCCALDVFARIALGMAQISYATKACMQIFARMGGTYSSVRSKG